MEGGTPSPKVGVEKYFFPSCQFSKSCTFAPAIRLTSSIICRTLRIWPESASLDGAGSSSLLGQLKAALENTTVPQIALVVRRHVRCSYQIESSCRWDFFSELFCPKQAIFKNRTRVFFFTHSHKEADSPNESKDLRVVAAVTKRFDLRNSSFGSSPDGLVISFSTGPLLPPSDGRKGRTNSKHTRHLSSNANEISGNGRRKNELLRLFPTFYHCNPAPISYTFCLASPRPSSSNLTKSLRSISSKRVVVSAPFALQPAYREGKVGKGKKRRKEGSRESRLPVHQRPSVQLPGRERPPRFWKPRCLQRCSFAEIRERCLWRERGREIGT